MSADALTPHISRASAAIHNDYIKAHVFEGIFQQPAWDPFEEWYALLETFLQNNSKHE